MSAWNAWGRCLWAGLWIACLTACSPWLDSPREDDHPLINEAVARKAMSPREAERLLEKALEANPSLARAHWELGLIRLNSTSNYAAAVYHFQRVLALRSDWPHASTATQLINQAKIELVREGVEAPTLPSARQQLDRYVAEIHKLSASVSNLQAQVRSLTVVTQQLAAENLQLRQAPQFAAAAPASPAPLTGSSVRPAVPPTDARPAGSLVARETRRPSTPVQSSPAVARANPARSPATPRPTTPAVKPGGRTHTFGPGDTAASVAKRYHFTVRDLMRANPGVNLSSVRAGQAIRLP
jgi:LysM repeat protein